MAQTNKLQQSPPFEVEQTIKRFGENLRIARIRRSLTIEEVAERIGTGTRAVSDAEKGKPSTSLVVYAAMLWLYNQIKQLDDLADPAKDSEGITLEASHARTRVRKKRALDRDF